MMICKECGAPACCSLSWDRFANRECHVTEFLCNDCYYKIEVLPKIRARDKELEELEKEVAAHQKNGKCPYYEMVSSADFCACDICDERKKKERKLKNSVE